MAFRKLDNMGRIVIPAKIRERLRLTENTLLEVDLKKDQIIIKRTADCCALCNDTKDIIEDLGVCKSCAEKIAARINGND